MSRLPTSTSLGVGVSGLLLGGALFLAGLLPVTPGSGDGTERRVVVTAGTLDRLRTELEAALGRAPTPVELQQALLRHLREEVLHREALARGYTTLHPDPRSALIRRLERVAGARMPGAPPGEEEVRAFLLLRGDRFAHLTPPGDPPMAGDPAWEEDPGWRALRVQVAAALEAEAREAAADQLHQEVAGGYRVAAPRGVRRLLAAEGGWGEGEPPPVGAGEGAGVEEGVALLVIVQEEGGRVRVALEPAAPLPPSTLPSLLLPSGCDEVRRELRHQGLHLGLQCAPAGLEGRSFRVVGLGGRAAAVHVEVETAAGRLHTEFFPPGPDTTAVTVPERPAAGTLAAAGAVAGLQGTALLPEFWLLLLVVGLLAAGRPGGREVGGLAGGIAAALLGFTAGHLAAGWGAGVWGPLLSPHLPAVAAVALALLLLAQAAGRRRDPLPLLAPLGLTGCLLGALVGGGGVAGSAHRWLTPGEAGLLGAFGAPGAAGALALMGMVAAATALLLGRSPVFRMVLGIAAVALLVPRAAALLSLLPTALPPAPFQIVLLALLLGVVLPALGLRLGGAALPLFLLPLLAGMALPAGPGALAGTLPSALVLAALFGVGATLLAGGSPGTGVVLGGGALAATVAGVHLRGAVEWSGALPFATALGAVLVAALLLHAGLRAGEETPREARGSGARLLGLAGVTGALLWHAGALAGWFSREVAAGWGVGLLPVPLAALALAALALVIRPQTSRVAELLGAARRPPPRHLAALALAFFLLPVGTLFLPNPLHPAPAPEEDAAREVVYRLLRNTYHAFNLEDEGELYDRLADSVAGELLPTLYLDSRRRLRAGIAEEDEVVVESVELLPGAVAGGGAGPAAGAAGFTWAGQWVVSARVRHLQHTHLRRNLYSGRLEVRRAGEEWRIHRVELTGEERTASPWRGP